MPKKTFFHLPKEKQERLIDAAHVEFSRVPLQEASIANIVKLAEIPRGSFYQYFEDKEDLYFYYFRILRKNSARDIEKSLEEAKGDLLLGMEYYFLKLMLEIFDGENATFYQHMFTQMSYQSTMRMYSQFPSKKVNQTSVKKTGHDVFIDHLFQLVDFEFLTIQSKQEFRMLMQLLMNTIFSSIAEGYRLKKQDLESDNNQIIENFKKKISWFRQGIYH